MMALILIRGYSFFVVMGISCEMPVTALICLRGSMGLAGPRLCDLPPHSREKERMAW